MDNYQPLPEIQQGNPAFAHGSKKESSYVASQSAPLLEAESGSAQHIGFGSQSLRRPTWLQRMGGYGISVLLFGTAAILLAFAFITFLWKGVNATTSWNDGTLSSLWRDIVVSGWATRATTLSSLVIRVAIATQAGVCTSMLAALLLEKVGVSLYVAPEVSVIRSSNTGPHHLAFTLLQGSLNSDIASVLTPILILMTTALLSQFSSTALLSDIENGVIVGSKNTTVVPFGRQYDPDWLFEYQGIDYWATKPAFYPAFAEYSEPPSQDEKWYDTGVTKRALPPFSTLAKRTSLKDYTGMAKIVDVRSACVRPSSVEASVWMAYWVPQLTGHVNGGLPIPLEESTIGSAGYYSPGIGIVNADFNCTIAMHKYTDDELVSYWPTRASKEWPVSLCRVYSPVDDNPPYDGAFLVINTTFGTWLQTPPDYETYNQVVTSDAEGPWLSVDIRDANVSVALSLCFTNSVSNDTYVTFTSDSVRTEPALGWDLDLADYDTLSIRRQLGVLPGAQSSLQDRGVLKLDPDFDLYKTGSNDTVRFERMAVDTSFPGNRSAGMCAFCMFTDSDIANDWSFWSHRDLVAVFQDVLISTRNPALALQAHYFTLLQMAYYDFLSEADVTTDARLVFFEETLMPRRWRGYAGVAMITTVHLICVLLSVILFLSLTKLSSIGNSWQAISQAVSGETWGIIASATTLSDSEVKRRIRSTMKAMGERKATFKVDAMAFTERVGLVRQVGR